MKRILILAVSAGLLTVGIGACKKNNGNNNNNNNNGNSGNIVEVPIDRSDTTTLPSPIAPLPLSLNFMDSTSFPGGPMQVDTFATKVDEFITPYGFTKNDIQSVQVTKLRINIENAASQYFNFVKDTTPISIKVFVDSFNGVAPKLVAYKESVPRNVNQLELTVDPSDIKDYFRADYMRILIGFRTQENEGLDGAAKFRVNYTFKVTAKMP
jgi:hypothetical protein